MKIGITERGDAGIDLSWESKLKYDAVDSAVLITKNITDKFREAVMRQYDAGKKIILHATCTGYGGTVIEPNVPEYRKQVDSLVQLVEAGFPIENCVLRIDPIIPTANGIKRALDVITYAEEKGVIPGARIRISIYDEYKHVKERLKDAGIQPAYPGSQFQASTEQFRAAAEALVDTGHTFYTCAEPKLLRYGKGHIKAFGCVSEQDFHIMGLEMPEDLLVNMQHRSGCLCLSCKTELLTRKAQCPHKCIYCYWKN